MAEAAEHEQPALVVRAHLAERHRDRRLARERDLAGVEELSLVRSVECTRAGIDRHVRGRAGVAAHGLAVDEMDGPGDLGLGRGELVDRPSSSCRGEHAEARGLALYAALGVLEPARRVRRSPGRSGPMKNSSGLLPTRATPIAVDLDTDNGHIDLLFFPRLLIKRYPLGPWCATGRIVVAADGS